MPPHRTRAVARAKIVFEGPGLAGKTANLDALSRLFEERRVGRLVRLDTETRRTLFFDHLTVDAPMKDGSPMRCQLFTVPGQVFYEGTRRLVLDGLDGVVFVADSDPERQHANALSLRRLEANLRLQGRELADVPAVLQVNKRDRPDAVPLATVTERLNRHAWPVVEACASSGTGVLETLDRILQRVAEATSAPREAAATAARA